MPPCYKEIDIEKSLWSALHGTFSFCSTLTLVTPWMVPKTPPVSLEEPRTPWKSTQLPASETGQKISATSCRASLRVALFLTKEVFRLAEDLIRPFPGLTAASCREAADCGQARVKLQPRGARSQSHSQESQRGPCLCSSRSVSPCPRVILSPLPFLRGGQLCPPGALPQLR